VTTTQTCYVYDGNQIVLQFDKTGTGDLGATDLSHRYLWGAAVDQLLADERVHYDSGQQQFVTDALLWALGDNQNTVRDLAVYNAGTGVTSVVNHRVFSAYGQLLSQTNPQTSAVAAVDCVFGFTGRPLSVLSVNAATGGEVGLQFNGGKGASGRWYDAITGRWLKPDDVWDGVNLYRYVGNSPTNLVDPAGTAVYIVARQLNPLGLGGVPGANPANPLTHQFVAVTDSNGKVTNTYSWGNSYDNNKNGLWCPNRNEDMGAAQAAVDFSNSSLFAQALSADNGTYTAPIKVGGDDLNEYAGQAYTSLSKPGSSSFHKWEKKNNCQNEARKLVDLAKQLQEKARTRK
jgi:RHS repeat-associated protein